MLAPAHRSDLTSRRRFALAWTFLLAAAALGVLLRWHLVSPLPAFHYAHLLHTHSHLAFLGWVGNAFFVAALRHFVPAREAAGYDRIWWALQAGVVGMAATFPFQGYGAASIAFAALHTAASAVFALKLWRGHRAAPAAAPHLRAALGFLLVSGAGPLALGPLAATGLRETPAYTLAIYFYLHCQYNGWFLFFLQALVLQRRADAGVPVTTSAAVRAAHWLLAGTVLTYAHSALWLEPAGWVYAAAGAGAFAQVIGCAHLWRSGRAPADGRGGLRPLERLALGCFLAKHALQAAVLLPGCSALAQERWVAIAFLHLVFLGVVTPALIAWAQAQGWWRDGMRERAAIAVHLAGVAGTEGLLILPGLSALTGMVPAVPLLPALLASAGVTLLGLLALGRPGRR